jgi:hypothetical protein
MTVRAEMHTPFNLPADAQCAFRLKDARGKVDDGVIVWLHGATDVEEEGREEKIVSLITYRESISLGAAVSGMAGRVRAGRKVSINFSSRS